MKIFKIKLGVTQVPAVIEMANEIFVVTLYDKSNYRSIYFIIIIAC